MQQHRQFVGLHICRRDLHIYIGFRFSELSDSAPPITEPQLCWNARWIFSPGSDILQCRNTKQT